MYNTTKHTHTHFICAHTDRWHRRISNTCVLVLCFYFDFFFSSSSFCMFLSGLFWVIHMLRHLFMGYIARLRAASRLNSIIETERWREGETEREYTVLGWRMEKCQNLIVFSDEWIWMWCTHEQMWWYANSNTHTHTQHTYLAWRHEEWCGEFEAEGVAVAKWIWSEFSTFISNIGRAAASGLRGYSNFVCFNWTFYLSVENNNTFYLLIWLKSWNLQIFCC